MKPLFLTIFLIISIIATIYQIYAFIDCRTYNGVYLHGVCIMNNTMKDYRP